MIQAEDTLVRAWRFVQRYRFLWLFGVLAGSAGVPQLSFFTTLGLFGTETSSQGLVPILRTAPAQTVTAIVLTAGFLYLSLRARASLIAAAQVPERSVQTLGTAWRLGAPFVTGLFGLSLWAGLISAAPLLVLYPLFLGNQLSAPSLGGLCALVAWLLWMFGIAVITEYAQRFIVIERLGAIASFAKGIRLVRQSALGVGVVWLISIAFNVLVTVSTGFISGITVSYTANIAGDELSSLFLIAVAGTGLFLLHGLANSFLSTLWTLSYQGFSPSSSVRSQD